MTNEGYYRRISSGREEVVPLQQLKRQLVWYEDDTSRDDEMILCINTAVDMVEGYTGIGLRSHTWVYYTDRWYPTFELKNGPIDPSAVTVKYYPSSDGSNLSTLASSNYKVSGPLSMIVIDGTKPGLFERPDAVQITYDVLPYTGSFYNRMKEVALILAAEMFEKPANSRDDLWKYTDRMLNSFRPLV